jgi:formamidopyrimidine-DNA glycosylase
MTGWFFKPHELPEFITEPNIIFEFENDDLNFTDFRNFGTLTFTDDIQQVVKEIDRLAPDILDDSTTFDIILERFDKLTEKTKEILIEDALMDQTLLFSGIGNIIKSELLYDAHISPLRKLKDLSRNDLHAIFISAKKISKRTLKHLNNKMFDPEGYNKIHNVYNKETNTDGLKIDTRTSKYGRTTFWVPEIQK